MSRFPYHFFDEFVIRTPLFSCKDFREKVKNDEISDAALKEIGTDPIFQEAIYLASPYLYEKLLHWLNSGKELTPKNLQKLKNTILKYYSRMSTRCTPFGLFSEVGLGKFKREEHNTSLPSTPIRDTKLDMHFLVALSQHLAKKTEIRTLLLYFPNSSIHRVGHHLRYMEYEYTNGKRDYIISSAPLSSELEQVINFSQQGKTIKQIVDTLINDEITSEDAEEFIEELIDNQVLISEIEPSVSGEDFLDTIISVLMKIGAIKESEILISIQNELAALDQNIGNPAEKYTEIENLIKSFHVEYEPNFLFQTDLYSNNEYVLTPHWKVTLKKGIRFLNKITLLNKDTHLEQFKKTFYERFETEEVPLNYALDTEIGIGYRQDVSTKGIHPYIQDLKLPRALEKLNLKIQLDPIQQVLNNKVQEALAENQYSIDLIDDDFRDFDENWQDLPDTLSFITEIISEKGEQKLFIGNGGGCSAANLLARFCSEKSEVQNLVKTIAKKEEEINSNSVLAEIIHLPEARIGNVIRRPTLRQYEIPYLAKSILPIKNQISVDDLYISLKNDRIVLRSKKLNKEISPYLTNAHNYSANPLPVYHFLCDLHSQNARTGLYFNWRDLKHIYQFLPRIEYRNIILSKAWWKMTAQELNQFSPLTNNKEQLLFSINEWRKKRQLPRWVQWIKSDNKLIINLENYDMTKMFIDAVKNEESIIIEEFLYNENDDFMHQYIFPLYKGN
ncbi:lantibiotic dehydratase [Chryseobacterium glaciei]|uniref:Lantibiotic dehydratase n=2 Tax=Chryseobacterium glaciei TaxID=1685010 RepID=A0A172Y259_9FLAO|nr:lantibiotic dehydratase [Chryseobacterium glaciei]